MERSAKFVKHLFSTLLKCWILNAMLVLFSEWVYIQTDETKRNTGAG
jgi:hypothetical protein